MASIIKQRTISSVVDNRTQLNNSSCARLWSTDIGTTWTHIRVCCRISINDLGGDLGSTPRFAFGIQTGTTNLFQDAVGPTHWVGAISNAASWARANQGSPAVDINYRMDPVSVAKKIGTSLTTGSNFVRGSGKNAALLWDCTKALRAAYILDITKGSPNFTFSLLAYVETNGFISGPDVTISTYLSQIVLTTPAFSFHEASANVTMAVDETANGFFNAVGISWNRSDALIEISDVTVVKLP